MINVWCLERNKAMELHTVTYVVLTHVPNRPSYLPGKCRSVVLYIYKGIYSFIRSKKKRFQCNNNYRSKAFGWISGNILHILTLFLHNAGRITCIQAIKCNYVGRYDLKCVKN